MSPTRSIAGLSVIFCAGLLTAAPARADLKFVQTTTISNPQITAALQSMTPQQRAQVQKSGGGAFFQMGPQTATVYVHGNLSRLDYSGYTLIADTGKKQLMTLNRLAHTYSVRPLTAPQGQAPAGATITDTHQTKMILGHLAHHYVVATPNVAGAGSQLKADIWSAPDLTQPLAYGQASGPAASIQVLMRRIKGLPLQTTVVIAGTPLGKITAKSVAKSISTSALPTSLFAVPAGFRPGATGSLGMGSPFGR